MRTQIYVLVIYMCLLKYKTSCEDIPGVDIGNRCTQDAECIAGNGGPYSKCHRPSSTCVCTVNIAGENKCNYEDRNNRCERKSVYSLYNKARLSALECTPEDESFEYQKYPTYFRHQWIEYSSTFINDKKTSVCYDPDRAYNTAPDGIVIKNSSIPRAGLGVFTDVFIEKGTVFGPCKGYHLVGNMNEGSAWSWLLRRDGSVLYWLDSRHVHMSNWLRFINMGATADVLNVEHFEFEGMFFYYAFRSINPGTELLSNYGDKAGKMLGVEEYTTPFFVYDAPNGFAGGECDATETGKECENDKNALCFQAVCICKPGTHFRHGICITDETLGGICTGSDGDICKADRNTECEGGVCVCKKGTSIFKEKCVPDETFGGRCSSPNGHGCKLDTNAECIHGLCRCKYKSSEMDGKCMKNEMFGGRCTVTEGEPCIFDKSTVCIEGFCKCPRGSNYIDGRCAVDGLLDGVCVTDKCHVENVVCDLDTKKCICETGYVPRDEKCVKQ